MFETTKQIIKSQTQSFTKHQIWHGRLPRHTRWGHGDSLAKHVQLSAGQLPNRVNAWWGSPALNFILGFHDCSRFCLGFIDICSQNAFPSPNSPCQEKHHAKRVSLKRTKRKTECRKWSPVLNQAVGWMRRQLHDVVTCGTVGFPCVSTNPVVHQRGVNRPNVDLHQNSW